MDLYPFQEIIPVSALKDDNLDTLLKVIKSYLKEGICYYGKDIPQKFTMRWQVAGKEYFKTL